MACQQYTQFLKLLSTKYLIKHVYWAYYKREQGEDLSILQLNLLCSLTLQRMNCDYFSFFKVVHFLLCIHRSLQALNNFKDTCKQEKIMLKINNSELFKNISSYIICNSFKSKSSQFSLLKGSKYFRSTFSNISI